MVQARLPCLWEEEDDEDKIEGNERNIDDVANIG